MNNLKISLMLAVLFFIANYTFSQSFVTQSIPRDGKSSIGFNYYRLEPFENFGDVPWHGIYELNSSLVLDKWVVGSSCSFIRNYWPENQRLNRFYLRAGFGSINGELPDFETSVFANVGLRLSRMLGKQNNQMLSLNFYIPTSDLYKIEDTNLLSYYQRTNAYNQAKYSFHSYNLHLNYNFELNTKSNWLLGGEVGAQLFIPRGYDWTNSLFNYAAKVGYNFDWFTLLGEAGGIADTNFSNIQSYFLSGGFQITKYKFQPGIFFIKNQYSPFFNGNSLGVQLRYRF